MTERDIERAKKDIDELGIIGIEPSGDLTSDVLLDAIDAVKSVNLDFKQWKKVADEHRRMY